MAAGGSFGDNFLSLLDGFESKNVGNQRGHQGGSGNKDRRGNDQRDGDNSGNNRRGKERSRGGRGNNSGNKKKQEQKNENNSKRRSFKGEIKGRMEEQKNLRSNSTCEQSEHGKSQSKRRGDFGSGRVSKNVDSKVPKMMGYKFLESLLDRDSGYVMTTLASSRSGFQELVNDLPIRPDLLLLIVRVLDKVSQSEIHQLKIQILSQTLKPEFIDEIKKYALTVCIEENKRLLTVSVFFSNVLSLFDTVIHLFPSVMNEKLKSLLVVLYLSMKNARDVQGIDIGESLFQQLTSLTDQVNSYTESKMKMDKEQKKTNTKETMVPNNFRELPLVPTEDDFKCDKAFLRYNIIKGSYRDVDHYLDVQFRLLREDFIAPLRLGIYEYVESLNSPHVKRRYSNVRIYHKVQFVKPCKSKDTFGFVIRFDCDNKLPKNINWEYSKRFMNSSLLLFTDNSFQTFYLATVEDRNISKLKKGFLFVALVPGTVAPDYLFEPGVFFVMAESEVYYEAYRHVLAALTRMTEKNFPMKQHIVDVDTACPPPSYLVSKRVYKISGYKVNVLDENSWPTPAQLKLNPSQHQAFKSALTNDFAVIQGPPGTGKTFLALKITESLLKNNVSVRTPIVVICYTNHALDQFLEGILKHTDNLIRIGGQSQNEALDKYNIAVVRKRKRYAGQLNLCLSQDAKDEKEYLQQMLFHIEKKVEDLSSPKGIFDLRVLKSVMTPQQYYELRGQEVEWLCYSAQYLNTEEDEIEASEPSEEFEVNDEIDQQNDVFENVAEFQETKELEEEEMDDEENERRLADMTDDDFLEDDFLEEDFIREENYASAVTYSLKYDDMIWDISKLDYELKECLASLDHQERFYLERKISESIKEIGWQLNFIQKQYLKLENLKFDPVKFETLQNMNSVWDISENDRWEYYMTWIHLYICQLKQAIKFLTESYQEVMLNLYELNQLEDLVFVRDAAVIGLTTSGAAKRRVLLENLNTKIVIVEEAAEVLEAHIVTSLTKSVQHVILIGDHKQLRPNPAVFELARKYHLDVSLFERMLRNGLNCSVLDVQHRMRPEISSLIVPAVYPSLANHPSTHNRPRISGIDKFVFFLTHNHPEDQLPDSLSKQNKHEAYFLIELCEYLMLQGYKPEEITILVTYSGQVMCMRQEKRKRKEQNPKWECVRITPVDNFQGEENRIILLSLVRSNKESKIGFLSTENRVCVALSRAREGLYIIGNMDNLTASSSIWPKIKKQLEDINAVGTSLTLRCERHPDQVTQVATSKDFRAMPEGGCSLMCEFELECGHKCPRVCHIIGKDHSFFKCMQPCERPPCQTEGHECPLRCWQPCEPCKVLVTKQLSCDHSVKVQCHVEPSSVACEEVVPVTLPSCGHDGFKPCFMDLEHCKCYKPCLLRLPCGHSCLRKCHVNDDPDHLEYKCTKPCTKQNVGCNKNHLCIKQCCEPCGACFTIVLIQLDCGHKESIECCKGPVTIQCKKPCKNTLQCGHKCKLQCWLPCKEEECTEVVLEKKRSCGHTVKNVKCNESPESVKCRANCTRLLACGHSCPDKCFNDCSKILCQELVPSRVMPACGHPAIQIPCHLNKPDLQDASDELVQLCQQPCQAEKLCGHLCTGTCGSCMQGRLHIPCKEKCNKVLICGHRCNSQCNMLCPPCFSKKCFNICNHSKCQQNHICKEPCQSCTRPCLWACEHFACKKQCGEECNRPACDVRCPDPLPCGHQCVGFCGEPHTPFCPSCERGAMDEVDPFDFDDERFVLLEDCNHVVNARIMDQLATADSGHGVVKFLQCPQCQKPVLRTMRYRSIYNRFRRQLPKLNQLVNRETVRLEKMIAPHTKLFQANPTTSPTMNTLLMDCSRLSKSNFKAYLGQLLTGCLLIPLVTRYCELKVLGESLDPQKEQRLRLRMEYLAISLRPRLHQISYTDILQIELEVARVLHALNPTTSHKIWYDVTPFTWARASTTQLPPRISITLRTRDGAKQWYQCDEQHLYVSENNEPCVTCRDEEEERNQRQEEEKLREEHLENAIRNRRSENRFLKYQNISVTGFWKKGKGRGRGIFY